MLNHIIRLPLLETKPQSLMTITLLIRLILVVLDLHKFAVSSRRIQAQAHETGDGGCLGDAAKGPGLLVLELDEVGVGADHFVAFVYGGAEEFGEGEPLPRHFVAVVGVDELVVVDAVGGVALYALDGRLAAVECDDLEHVNQVAGSL